MARDVTRWWDIRTIGDDDITRPPACWFVYDPEPSGAWPRYSPPPPTPEPKETPVFQFCFCWVVVQHADGREDRHPCLSREQAAKLANRLWIDTADECASIRVEDRPG